MRRSNLAQLSWRLAVLVAAELGLLIVHGGIPARAADHWVGTWSTAEVGRPQSPPPAAPLFPPFRNGDGAMCKPALKARLSCSHDLRGGSGSQWGFRNFSTKLSTGPSCCCVEKSRGSIASRQKLPSATNIRTLRAIWTAG
jgi:hypothetical protein